MKENMIKKLVDDLTQRMSPTFNHSFTPAGTVLYKQVHPETKFIYVHSYATKQVATGIS